MKKAFDSKLFMNNRIFPTDEEIKKLEASLTMSERGFVALVFYPEDVLKKLHDAILSWPLVEMEGEEDD